MLFVADVDGHTVTVTRSGETEAGSTGTPTREWFIRWGDDPVWVESALEVFPPEPGGALTHTYPRPGGWFVELYSPAPADKVPALFEVQYVEVNSDGRPGRHLAATTR